MTSMWSDFFDSDPDETSRICDALEEKKYSAFYALMRKQTETFTVDKAYTVCKRAIGTGCTIRAFKEILLHCPPLQDFICYETTALGMGRATLTEYAVSHDRADILQIFLENGISPNARGKSYYSAVETALLYGALDCMEILAKYPDLDTTITETVLNQWARCDMNHIMRDLCCRTIAPRYVEGDSLWGIPLLPGLSVIHAAGQDNWNLFKRICREGTVSVEDGKQAVHQILYQYADMESKLIAELLDALFTACPGLLKCKQPRYALVFMLLCEDAEAEQILKPWLEKMPGKYVVLETDYYGQASECVRWTGKRGLLSRWEERIGEKFVPALDRNAYLLDSFHHDNVADWDAEIRTVLKTCHIKGTPKPGRVSVLAEEILASVSMEYLPELLLPGSFLYQEDTEALYRCCIKRGEGKKQAAVAAFLKREVTYEL